MKARESGMPEEEYWESLFDVDLTLNRLCVNSSLESVAEFGCGYGTFSIPVAARIRGRLATFDIEPAMVRRTNERAAALGLSNVDAELRDVLQEGFGLGDATQDAVLLFNILHTEAPVNLLEEAARVARPGGMVLVTHWRYDASTPRGPSLTIRPRPEDILRWAEEVGLLNPQQNVVDLPPYHYGILIRRPAL